VFFQGHSCIEMEGQEFLTEYRSISNKLKKRFLRRPNVSEASDHFRQLGRKLEDAEEPQYAAFCHLATSRCEQTVGNSPAEIDATTAAARSFLRAEMEVQSLGNPSFEEQLTAASASYSQAARLQQEAGRDQLAACLLLELAQALVCLQRPVQALPVFQRAAKLLEGHTQEFLRAKLMIADCYIATPDHHNALLVLSEVHNFAVEHDACNLYGDLLENVEILRVLLLLIIQPSQHNTSPQLLDVLERYRGTEAEELPAKPSPYLDLETSLLLQSVVLAVEGEGETEALLYLEDELAPRLTDQQRRLLRITVAATMSRV